MGDTFVTPSVSQPFLQLCPTRRHSLYHPSSPSCVTLLGVLRCFRGMGRPSSSMRGKLAISSESTLVFLLCLCPSFFTWPFLAFDLVVGFVEGGWAVCKNSPSSIRSAGSAASIARKKGCHNFCETLCSSRKDGGLFKIVRQSVACLLSYFLFEREGAGWVFHFCSSCMESANASCSS